MTRSLSCHLLDILAEVPDPRHKKGKRHPLVSILALIVIGLMSNHKGYTSIATWARNQPELAKALGFRSPKTPCAATIHNLLKRLDVVSLEASLTKWVFSKLENFQVLKTKSLEGVAIDGKELCGSKNPETGYRTHLLSAVSHELAITLTQCAVSEKTNEIPISTELLKAFDVVGKVVTTDALLTQRKPSNCKALLTKNSGKRFSTNRQTTHYPSRRIKNRCMMTFKTSLNPFQRQTHPKLKSDALQNLHTQTEAHLDTHTDVEKSRGFITTRTLTASTLLTDYINWPGLAQVYQYRSQREHEKNRRNHPSHTVWHHEPLT